MQVRFTAPYIYILRSASRAQLDQPPSSTPAAIFTPCVGPLVQIQFPENCADVGMRFALAQVEIV